MFNTQIRKAEIVKEGFSIGNPDHDYLTRHGWIPLGKLAFTDVFGWTTMARGLRGAVSTAEALEIQRREDGRGLGESEMERVRR